MRLIASLLLVAMLPLVVHAQATPAVVAATSTITTIPDVPAFPSVQLPTSGEILALDQGDRAPHDGMLVLDDDLVAWRQAIERLTYELAATRSLDAQTCTLRLHEETMRTTAAEDRLTLHESLWRDRVTELAASLATSQAHQGPSWWENPLLWTVVGAVLGGAMVGLIAGAIR